MLGAWARTVTVRAEGRGQREGYLDGTIKRCGDALWRSKGRGAKGASEVFWGSNSWEKGCWAWMWGRGREVQCELEGPILDVWGLKGLWDIQGKTLANTGAETSARNARLVGEDRPDTSTGGRPKGVFGCYLHRDNGGQVGPGWNTEGCWLLMCRLRQRSWQNDGKKMRMYSESRCVSRNLVLISRYVSVGILWLCR